MNMSTVRAVITVVGRSRALRKDDLVFTLDLVWGGVDVTGLS